MTEPIELPVPELSLVVLVGVSGSGKSTFAARVFEPFEVVSSDFCRGLVSGDENDQSASADAFDVLNHIVGKRLDRGLLTVVDATNVTREARAELVRLARDHDVLPVAIVLDIDAKEAIARNRTRPGRGFGDASSTTAATFTVPSTSSATSMAASTSWPSFSVNSATPSPAMTRAAPLTRPTRRDAPRSSSVTSSTVAPHRWGCCGWRWA